MACPPGWWTGSPVRGPRFLPPRLGGNRGLWWGGGGYFPVGAELTSGRPDLKEGLYFGAELPGGDPRVLAGIPLHGPNLFPRQLPRLRPLVLAYLDALTSLGQAVLAGGAL